MYIPPTHLCSYIPLHFLFSSSRSLSPHSPRSPHTSQHNSGSINNTASTTGMSGSSGRRLRVPGGRMEGGGEEETEAKRQSALLQVSEAHLAILPDEDGDT